LKNILQPPNILLPPAASGIILRKTETDEQ
jgi:hypothetical protein